MVSSSKQVSNNHSHDISSYICKRVKVTVAWQMSQGEKRVIAIEESVTAPTFGNPPQSPYQIPICVLSGARINTDQKIAKQWAMSLLALNKES